MSIAVTILIILLLAVFMVMVAGVVLMGKGGEKNKKYANKFMMARVWFQGLALVMIAVIYFLAGGK